MTPVTYVVDAEMLPARIDTASGNSPSTDSTTIRLEDLRRLDLSCVPDAQFVDDRLARLERSMDAIRGVVVHLRGLHNASTQVSRIPPELLTRIFSHLQDRDSDLVRITHVCRRWREVALDCSQLWTRAIVTSSVRKGEAYIRRSRRRLVEVYFKPSCDYVVWQFPRILRLVADRLHTLIVEAADATAIGYLMAQFWSLPVPHLETLHLLGSVVTDLDRRVVEKLKRGRDIFMVPTNGGGDLRLPHSPALRSLRLHPICVNWRSSIYHGLTVLEVRVPGMVPPSQERILEILRQCPGLESLHLDLSALVEPTVPISESTDVTLPILSTCTLVSLPPTSIADLLSHLILPPATRYKIVTAAIEQGLWDPDPPEYAILPQDYSRLAGLETFHMIEFAADTGSGVVHIHCYNTSIGGLGDPVLELTVSSASDPCEVFSGLTNTFDLFVLDTFVVSGVHIDPHPVVNTWSDFFGSAGKLRTLRLVGLDPRTISNAFEELDFDSRSGPVSCRELEDIELVDVSLHEGWLVENIVRCVESRKLSGSPLKRLDLLEARAVPDGMVASLKESGIEVSVNEC